MKNKNNLLLVALVLIALCLTGAMAYIYIALISGHKAVSDRVPEQPNIETEPKTQEEPVAGSPQNVPVDIAAKSYGPAELPGFSDFAVDEVYSGVPVEVNFSSDPDAVNFKTRLVDGAAKGPNFAGHYTVITWGCGTSCMVVAIIDAKTGKVNILPGVNPWVELGYRIDSSLLVVNDDPKFGRETAANKNASIFNTDYYDWNDGKLNPLYSRDYVKEIESGSLSNDPNEVAETFYAWYFACDSKYRDNCDYGTRPDLTAEFKKRFETYVNYDQLMCFQDPTHDVSYGQAKIESGGASIEMTQKYLSGEQTITIKLIKEGGRWKINDLVCPSAPEAKG